MQRTNLAETNAEWALVSNYWMGNKNPCKFGGEVSKHFVFNKNSHELNDVKMWRSIQLLVLPEMQSDIHDFYEERD